MAASCLTECGSIAEILVIGATDAPPDWRPLPYNACGRLMTLPEIEIIEFEGRQVEIRQAGQGPVLFLLHGIGSGSEAWLHQFPAFADRYRVIAWAAPGYGQSTDVTSDAPVPRDYAKVLDSLLTALSIDQAIFCGNSLGALFSGAFANLTPDRVRGLFLSDAARGHAHLEEADRLEKLRARLTPLETLGVERMAKERAGRLQPRRACPVGRRSDRRTGLV